MSELTTDQISTALAHIDDSAVIEAWDRPTRFFVNTGVVLASGSRFVIRWPKGNTSEQHVYHSLGAQVAVLRYLAEQEVPAPRVYHADLSYGLLGRPYAVMDLISGEILANVMGRLDVSPNELRGLISDAGTCLRRIHAIRLSKPGRITSSGEPDGFNVCLEWTLGAKGCREALARLCEGGTLSQSSFNELERIVHHFAPICAHPPEGYCLLHGDYHAWNILADRGTNGAWQITGTIDTEEALSGDIYFDLAVTEHYVFRTYGGWLREPFLEGYGRKINWARYRFYCLARFLGFDQVTPPEKEALIDMLERPGKSADMEWYKLRGER